MQIIKNKPNFTISRSRIFPRTLNLSLFAILFFSFFYFIFPLFHGKDFFLLHHSRYATKWLTNWYIFLFFFFCFLQYNIKAVEKWINFIWCVYIHFQIHIKNTDAARHTNTNPWLLWFDFMSCNGAAYWRALFLYTTTTTTNNISAYNAKFLR